MKRAVALLARSSPTLAAEAMIAHCKLLMVVVVACLLQAAAACGAPPPLYSPDRTLGAGSCASSLCHGSVDTWKNSGVLQTEYMTWSRSDKHARSYAVLLNERSRQIAEKLALPEPAHKSAVCLDCHTHNPKPAHRAEGFRITDGVACEACHGPAERWVKSHVEPGATHADNLARGMYPTHDDVARARLCLSCHIGNQDKFVTHRIMAAGHPRMSFELDTFTQIGPAHFRIDADWQQRKGTWDGVRAWAIGQAVAAQDLLSLLQSPRGRDDMFPELVLFDCHSCHHAMGDKRATAVRVGAGPGIVHLNDASLLMLRQIARRVAPDQADAFAQQVSRLHKAVAAGDDALAEARAVEDRVTAIIPKISGHRFSSDDLRGILNGLIDDGLARQYTDYQGAEQAAMAVQSVTEFMGRHGLLRTLPLQPAMRQLLAAVAHDENYRPAAFEQALRNLKTSIDSRAKQ